MNEPQSSTSAEPSHGATTIITPDQIGEAAHPYIREWFAKTFPSGQCTMNELVDVLRQPGVRAHLHERTKTRP